jgi:hypothetical protein
LNGERVLGIDTIGMAIITLLTDFGLKDSYVGVMKGVIASINEEAKVIDISHQVEPQNILEAAFLLRSAYRYFPKGTVHLVVVDPGVGSERSAIIVDQGDRIFVAPDNGVVSWSLRKSCGYNIYGIENPSFFLAEVSSTFHGRDIFAPVAAYLSKGMHPSNFGKKRDRLKTLEFPPVSVKEGSVTGEVVYIDRFGNLVTNIEQGMVSSGALSIRVKGVEIPGLSSFYAEKTEGELVAIIGSLGFLEVSVNLGSAKEVLQTKVGDKVEVILG